MMNAGRILVMLSFLVASGAAAQEGPEPDPYARGLHKDAVPLEPDPEEAAGASDSVEDPFSVYSKGQIQEIYIDEDYRLYDLRPYQGLVPGHPERGEPEDGVVPSGTGDVVVIRRIGLEQKELFSRVFAAVDVAITPWVYDNYATADANPGTPYRIILEIVGGKIPKRNDRRPLDARAFNSPILDIQGVLFEGGARVIITLKRKARYLPAQSGQTLYVDIER